MRRNSMAGVVRFQELGGPEVLRIEKIEIPTPTKGEAQIRIHAQGLNRVRISEAFRASGTDFIFRR